MESNGGRGAGYVQKNLGLSRGRAGVWENVAGAGRNVLMPGKICTFQEHTNLIELVGYPTTPAYYLSVVQREHALLNLALPLDGVQSHFMDAPPA